MVSRERLANEAIYIEQIVLNERVGVQDQLAAANGGLNYMLFQQHGDLKVNPVILPNERRALLQDNLMLFYTGISRYAHQVLEEQLKNTKENKITQNLGRIRKMVDEGLDILCSDRNLNLFGELMHEAWMAKRGLSSAISNNFLDDVYDRAKKAGAIGGKLLGAGGGGFFMFYVPIEKREAVLKALHDLAEVPFSFETDGSRIIFMS